jgi:hypothetical protein
MRVFRKELVIMDSAVQGSHAQEFGSMSIATEHASNFEGFRLPPIPAQVHETVTRPADYINVEQHEADLHHLRLAAAALTEGSTHRLDADQSLMPALDEQGQGIAQTGADKNSGGTQRHASAGYQAAPGDAVVAALLAMAELQTAVAERSRVDEVMSTALELLLWDGGVGELLGMQPQAGMALLSLCLIFVVRARSDGQESVYEAVFI